MERNQHQVGYETKSVHNFFDVAHRVVGKEINPSYMITFINLVDLTEIDVIRKSWGSNKKPTYTAFIAKAISLALKEFPYANRRLYRRWWLPFSKTKFQIFNSVDIAIACERNEPGIEVATFMDVLRNVEKLPLSGITDWLEKLSASDMANNKQWRDFFTLINTIPSCLSSYIISLPLYFPSLWYKWRGGAAVISSPGKYGVDLMLGSWPAPLGFSFGYAKERLLSVQGKPTVRRAFYLTLNWDRRIMAGAQGARFFKRIVDILEDPKREMPDFLV